MGFPGETPESGVQSHRPRRGRGAHRIRSSSGKARGRAWGCPRGRTGEPEAEGSPGVGEEAAGGTGAAKRETVETETGRAREVTVRSLPPVGWAELTESRSSS